MNAAIVEGRGAHPRIVVAALAMIIAASTVAVPAVAGSPSSSIAPSPAVAPVPAPPPEVGPFLAVRPSASLRPFVFPPVRATDVAEWAGDRPLRPSEPFKVRPFPLPARVPWEKSFPSGRWKGPVAASGRVDAEGLPVRRWLDGVDYYTPTSLGIQALRRLHAYNLTGDPAYLAMARRMADKLRAISVREGAAIWLPFDYNDKRARMRAPWVNALGQACALALFSRLHRIEGRAEDLEFAVGLFESFRQLRRPDGPWVSEVDPDGYVWFEHYPDGRRGHVLNAHAYAVIALRDYWQETRSPEARRWLEAGLTTLRDKGALFRREGTWSWYNLRNPVAHANYHLFHIRQLRALAPASGDPWFRGLADLMATDYESKAVRRWWDHSRNRAPTDPIEGDL